MYRYAGVLTELCGYLHNWDFNKHVTQYHGHFEISEGAIKSLDTGYSLSTLLKNGQYVRLIESDLNDGVYKYLDAEAGDETLVELQDETFEGTVWALSVPREVLDLAEEIAAWKKRYEDVESTAMSPYQSESFGGYSYSKGSGGSSSDSASNAGWHGVFSARLAKWRRLP